MIDAQEILRLSDLVVRASSTPSDVLRSSYECSLANAVPYLLDEIERLRVEADFKHNAWLEDRAARVSVEAANVSASEQLRTLAERITVLEKERDAAQAALVANNAALDGIEKARR